MKNLIAGSIDIGNFSGKGPLGLEGKSPGEAPDVFNQVISAIIGLITIIASIWFIFLIITGAIGVMNAGGDKGALETARKRITTGVAGFVIVVAGFFIATLIGDLLGIDLLDPGGAISNLGPT